MADDLAVAAALEGTRDTVGAGVLLDDGVAVGMTIARVHGHLVLNRVVLGLTGMRQNLALPELVLRHFTIGVIEDHDVCAGHPWYRTDKFLASLPSPLVFVKSLS